MIDRLATPASDVRHQAIAVVGDPGVTGKASGDREHPTQQRTVGVGQVGRRGDMAPRDEQDVRRGARRDVPEGDDQVVLPKDPDKGYIVVYEFPDTGRATAAATEQQGYLGSGPGRVQTPQGTVSVIRQVGSTVVLYQWLPAAANDPSAAGIQTALETLGVGYPVAN